MPKVFEFAISACFGAGASILLARAEWWMALAWAAAFYALFLTGKYIYGRIIMGKGRRLRATAVQRLQQSKAERAIRDPETYGMPPGLPPIGEGGLYMYGNGKAVVRNNQFRTGGRLTAINNDEVIAERNTFGDDGSAA